MNVILNERVKEEGKVVIKYYNLERKVAYRLKFGKMGERREDALHRD